MRRSSIIFSAAFHAGVVVLSAIGLPFLMKREFIIPPPIVVEFVEISKVTETDKVQPPKPAEKPPAAAQNTATEAAAPAPKEKAEPEEKKEAKKADEAEPLPAPDKKPPPEKSKKPKTEQAKKDPSKDFSSVLKNLLDPKDKPTVKAEKTESKEKLAPAQNAPLGAKMTMSEEDALRTQLEKCWNVPFGAKDAENMAVDIFMVINPDRTLREARVVDQTRYNADSFYRAAADSALRAVRNPLCSPFDLPPDKYDVWNRVTVTFNPKDMF